MTPSKRQGAEGTILRRLVVIGGGDMTLDAVDAARTHGIEPEVVLAPRHASEQLVLRSGSLSDALAGKGVQYDVVEQIGSWVTDAMRQEPGGVLGLCFGPAWIFDRQVRSGFGLGMFNVNAIPVPRYLGGAHYSWQILHGCRQGGCVIQEITDELDRGDLVSSVHYEVPAEARHPIDFYRCAVERAGTLVREFLATCSRGDRLQRAPFASLEAERLYLPRLFTPEHAWIDWAWCTSDIERFCCAFDRPYRGAATFLGDHEIRLRDVRGGADDLGPFHPFTAGIVVRRTREAVWIAARDGALRVREATDENGRSVMNLLREGRRLVTPGPRLERALAWVARFTSIGVRTEARNR